MRTITRTRCIPTCCLHNLATTSFLQTNRKFHTSVSHGKYYAVRSGWKTGIYDNWADCQKQVQSFRNAEFKSFVSLVHAEQYLNYDNMSSPQTTAIPTQLKQQQQQKRNNLADKMDDITAASAITTTIVNNNESNESSVTKVIVPFDLSSLEQRKEKQMKHQSDEALSQYEYVVAYTDGSCLGNGQNGAVAGIGVYFGEDDERNISEPLSSNSKMTNQRAEIQAVIFCLQLSVANHEHVRILTDSKYLINAMTTWRWSWEANGWKTKTNATVGNMDLFMELCTLVDSREGGVRFEYVPGHAGVVGNERADQLAVAGAGRSRLLPQRQ